MSSPSGMPSLSGPVPAVLGPMRSAERSPAPDLARGGVLAGIALANVSLYLYGREFGAGGRPLDGSSLDRALDLIVTLLVNDRSRPMFGLLFGFGMATMVRRMTERGAARPQRRAVLVRRSLVLIALGAVHAALLFDADILGVYGVTGLIALLLVKRRPRTQLAWAVLGLLSTAVIGGLIAVYPHQPLATTDYLASIPQRLLTFGGGLLLASLLLFMLAPTLAGIAIARAGLLDRPWEHRPRLRRLAIWGVAVGTAGGLPYALIVGRVWDAGDGLTAVAGALHMTSGLASGLGYVALFGLWAARRHDPAGRPARRPGPVGRALAATGERSLTCYLLQSMLFAPLLAPWGLGLGDRLGTATAYGIAVAVWLLTVAAGWALARAGRRGPFELLLRRFTYPRNPIRAGAGG